MQEEKNMDYEIFQKFEGQRVKIVYKDGDQTRVYTEELAVNGENFIQMGEGQDSVIFKKSVIDKLEPR